MKVVYMGTPDFAVPPLKALVENHQVVAVISQPDRPKGRGKHLVPTPVKEEALKHNIPVYQPEKIKSPEAVELICSLDADIFVVAAYGQILPESLLNKPKYGCINIHGSLLPKYRGAAPIQWSIINGDKTTGVTIMYMEKGLDTGDMLLKKEIPIEPQDTYGSLYDKISSLGVTAVLEAMDMLEKGTARPQKQQEELATYAGKIEKAMGRINWQQPADVTVNLIRGFNPMPVAHTLYGEESFKIWQATATTANEGVPGQILTADPKAGLVVKCGGNTAVIIEEIQAKGGKRMHPKDYLRGHTLQVGSIFS